MQDLFADLSSISDCDDECLLKLSANKNKSIFIQATIVQVVCSFQAAYELEIPETKISKQKRLEEKSCETDTKKEEKTDKWVQTDEIFVESKSCLADLPPTSRIAEYDESALERVLRHISAYLHRTQLQQWMSEKPERNASFQIKPVQAPNIFNATYNNEKATFVLLLSADSKYFIELRSLKNLLKSVDREVTCFKPNDRLNLYSSNQFIAVFSSNKIKIMDVDRMDDSHIFDVDNVVSIMVYQNHLHYINEKGIVSKLDLESHSVSRVFDASPLLCPILSCSVISDHFYSVSAYSLSSFSAELPLDYECYESEKLGFRSISHQLCFGSGEHTVDVACDDEYLYSLTSGGVVSLWKLRPNGRKYRDKLYTTFLSHCTQILLAFPQKFVLQTHTGIHFLIFGADSEHST